MSVIPKNSFNQTLSITWFQELEEELDDVLVKTGVKEKDCR